PPPSDSVSLHAALPIWPGFAVSPAHPGEADTKRGPGIAPGPNPALIIKAGPSLLLAPVVQQSLCPRKGGQSDCCTTGARSSEGPALMIRAGLGPGAMPGPLFVSASPGWAGLTANPGQIGRAACRETESDGGG